MLIAVKCLIGRRLFTHSTPGTTQSDTMCFVTQQIKLFPLYSMVATWVVRHGRLQIERLLVRTCSHMYGGGDRNSSHLNTCALLLL